MAYERDFGPRWRGGPRRGRRRFRRAAGPGRWPGRGPGRPARGFPVRGIHSYDLDYGRQAGGPDTDYSGRAGWPTGVREEPERWPPRGAWYPEPGYEYWLTRRPRRYPAYEERHWAAAEPSRYIRRRGRPRGGPRGLRW